MPALLAAAGIGAAVGALAGLAVYGAKAALSDEVDFHWKDALAHAGGGLVGGAAFPFTLAALGAAGVPAVAGYIASGGIAWGGIWTLAQDGIGVLLGRQPRLGGIGRYAKAAAIGALVSAMLVPAARLVVGPGGALAPRPNTTAAFLGAVDTPAGANLVKAEAEFLAFGVANEGIDAGINAAARAGARPVLGAITRTGGRRALGAGGVESANELVAPEPAPTPPGTTTIAPPLATPVAPARHARGFTSVLDEER